MAGAPLKSHRSTHSDWDLLLPDYADRSPLNASNDSWRRPWRRFVPTESRLPTPYSPEPDAPSADLIIDNQNGNSPFTYSSGASTFGNIVAGQQTTGALFIQGGSLTATTSFGAGAATNSNGTINLSGGTVTSTTSTVFGLLGTGTLRQTGGIFDASQATQATYLGQFANSVGDVTLSGASSQFLSKDLVIGDRGAGYFTQFNGTHTASGAVILGQNANTAGTANGTGTYTLNGGTFTANGGTNIGFSGKGIFNQTGGTYNASNATASTVLGESAGGTGTVTLGGLGSVFRTKEEIIGDYGNGSFVQNGGTHTISSTFFMGLRANTAGTEDGKGTYTLNGGTFQPSGFVSIGTRGIGILNQTGGTFDARQGSLMAVGQNPGSTGMITMSGADSVFLTRNLYIGYQSTGSFTQNGGTHTVSGNFYLGDNQGLGPSGNGSYTLNGGTLKIDTPNFGALVGGRGPHPDCKTRSPGSPPGSPPAELLHILQQFPPRSIRLRRRHS